jgi:hypothetical protein
MQRSDWNKWKEEIEAELASLYKREVFLAVICLPLLVSFLWDTSGFSFTKGTEIMRWQDTKQGL